MIRFTYPDEPVHTWAPNEAPKREDGRQVFANDEDVATAKGIEGLDPAAGIGADIERAIETTAKDHIVSDCQDHPIRQSAALGVNTVNDDSKTECDTNKLSGVNYNAFSSGPESDSIFDKSCQQIDSTVNSKWIVDNHGTQKNPPGKSVRKRTPPIGIDSDSKFNFELSWERDNANNGCGQNPESCWGAFARLVASPCGHQGDEQDGLTTAGKITLPRLRSLCIQHHWA
ncbi:MAG: hypothetical protein Q9203_005941 [Teloschistes exilis]